MPFPNRLSLDQVGDLEKDISHEEIRNSVWDCGVRCFPRGGNSSFFALIPKVTDAKFVANFRPISLVGSVYKVVTKILANRLAMVISDLVSNTQSAFVASRQILDGPLILNEAYDSVRWDFLLDVLSAFGFGSKWCHWIRGILSSNMASVLVNGSPTTEFPIYRGLKQGDPLAPFFFILIKESLHLFISRAVNDGEWSYQNLDNLLNILRCFHLASDISVAVKWGAPSLDASFRRRARVGAESNQWSEFCSMLDSVTLSSSPDRIFCDLNGEGEFRVKDIRSSIDDTFLPSSDLVIRWVKIVPIKVNILAGRTRLDRLPTRVNLITRGYISKNCRWWNIQWVEVSTYAEWYSWFISIRLPAKLKLMLEGVF
nr:RNA-directed DNA polymerase, eukaryota [Tanacetum cinerariifolium]